ncbi:hypothetical protein, partial [Corallococcus praedator]|uniref:hypothetical protein n=1 Tax=Corallococcus praedator TaxID=2316724 RepID=UPI0013154B2D
TYVGHAGKFVGGRYVGYDPKTEAADAKRAVANVAKHGYIDKRTINTRMALDNTALVAKQSDLMNDRARISSSIDTWAQTERIRLLAGATLTTKAQERAYTRRLNRDRVTFDETNPQITTGQTRKLNGGQSTS